MKRRFWFLRSDELKPFICVELAAYVPGLEGNIEFLRAIPAIIGSGAYTAYRVDELSADGKRSRYGGGLIGSYESPFLEEHLFGIEAAWFRDEDSEAHSFVWHMLLNEARDASFGSLCVLPATVTHPPAMPDPSHEWNDYGVVREKHTLMRAPSNAVWSAFLGSSPWGPPRFVDCLRVVPSVAIDLCGIVYNGPNELFRGEGRIGKGPYSNCSSLDHVAGKIFHSGILARGSGAFSGTLPEQIRHQGYIASPTVSLTASADIAVHYGTQGGRLDKALVIVCDPKILRTAGPIWDSFKSMSQSTTSAQLESDFELVVRLVSGLGHLQKAGSVLEGIANGIQRFVSTDHEMRSLTSGDYRRFVDRDVWDTASTVLTDEEITQVCSVLEVSLAWHMTSEGIVTPSRYASAFVAVRQELIDALADAGSEWQHPGWDTTIFGYFAKTCRDREYFSSGHVAGEAIKEARIVDARGRQLDILQP